MLTLEKHLVIQDPICHPVISETHLHVFVVALEAGVNIIQYIKGIVHPKMKMIP